MNRNQSCYATRVYNTDMKRHLTRSVTLGPELMRLFRAISIGLICFILSYLFRGIFYPGPGDLWQALAPAFDFLAGRTPFSRPVHALYVPSPLTIIPLGLLFTALPDRINSAAFVGLSCAWLAWHFQRPSWRLISFLSLPMLENVQYSQYLPLVIALSLSHLAPLALLIKPNVAIPLVLTFKSHRVAWILAIAIFALSLILFGIWPITWLHLLVPYQGFIPLLTFPGVLIATVLLFRRDRPAWLLVLLAAMPQRGIYDLLALSLLPSQRREMLVLTLIGWLSFFVIQLPEHSAMLLFFYAPAWIALIAPVIKRSLLPGRGNVVE